MRRLRHVDAPTLDEFFRRSTYRHRVEATWTHDGWVCTYWFWWSVPSPSGEELPGERCIFAPTFEEEDAGVRYPERAQAEAALWKKIKSFDLDEPMDPLMWRRLPGYIQLIGAITPTSDEPPMN